MPNSKTSPKTTKTSWTPSSKYIGAYLPAYVFSHFLLVVPQIRFLLPNSQFTPPWAVIGIGTAILFLEATYVESKRTDSPFATLLLGAPGALLFSTLAIGLSTGLFPLRTYAIIVSAISPFALLPYAYFRWFYVEEQTDGSLLN